MHSNPHFLTLLVINPFIFFKLSLPFFSFWFVSFFSIFFFQNLPLFSQGICLSPSLQHNSKLVMQFNSIILDLRVQPDGIKQINGIMAKHDVLKTKKKGLSSNWLLGENIWKVGIKRGQKGVIPWCPYHFNAWTHRCGLKMHNRASSRMNTHVW